MSALWRENSQFFKLEWVPIIHQVIEEGTTINWAHILYSNILAAMRKFKEAPLGNKVGFLMSAFIMDVVCANNSFPF